jgi:POT family proton-dependent oligopeptide transporter
MPVMSLFPIFWMLYDQQTSVWTLQATKLQLHGLQPEQLIIINPFEIMIFIPLFDRLIYPFLEYMGVNLPHLRRMRWGMVLAALAFSLSGFLESAIQRNPPNSISVAYQLPQITFLAIAEIFISVTGLEFAYSTSPERIKAFLMGMYLLTTAAGDLLGGILYSTFFQSLNRATVMHVCAGLMIVNLFIFCWVGQGWEEQRKRSDSGVELTSLKGDASEESLHSSRRKHKDLLLLEESIDSVR